MTTYARNVEGQAVDVVTRDPAELFHPDVAGQFVIVPDGTENGATYANGVWTNPVRQPPPPPVLAPEDWQVTKLAFLQRFTLEERMRVYAAAGTDLVVADFLRMVELATFIDMAREDTVQGVGYLVTKDYLSAERAHTILTAPVQMVERPKGA